MTSADRAPLALSFRRMEIFCATYERELHSTHPRVVITMPPPRKTHLEALIEKAPVESKGFFFIECPTLSGLGGPCEARRKRQKMAHLKMKDRPDVFASRKHFQSDTQRHLYGTQGPASAVRRIEGSAIVAPAIVAQMEDHIARAEAKRGRI